MPYYDEHYDKAVGVFLLILTLIGGNYFYIVVIDRIDYDIDIV